MAFETVASEMHPNRFYRVTLCLTTVWAFFGGAVLGSAVLGSVVLVNVISVAGTAAAGLPIPGDLELTEIGIAVAIFAFLPYCQMAGANVTADIFTSRLSPGWLSILARAASLVALLWAVLLLWRMWAGMEDQRSYNCTSTILEIPLWLGFVPCLISLALLAAASFATLLRADPDGA